MARRWPFVFVGIATIAFAIAIAANARAQKPTLSGRWSASAMTESWSVEHWGDKCGPRPQGQGAGAGTVTISQNGNELSIQGAGRSYATTQCWDNNPSLHRVAHSASSRAWSNQCHTAPSDPRQAKVSTVISATDDTLSFRETGHYKFVLQEQTCSATVVRSRSFKLIERLGQATPMPSASGSDAIAVVPSGVVSDGLAAPDSPTQEVVAGQNKCETTGELVRLEVLPTRKLLQAGQSFTFVVRGLDARGCAVAVSPTWNVSTTQAKISVTPAGRVIVREDSPEGVADVIVTAGGKTLRAVVEVASKQRYEELLRATAVPSSDARAGQRESDQTVAATALGGGVVRVEDTGTRGLMTAVIVLAFAALGVAAVSLWLLMTRTKRKKRSLPQRLPHRVPEDRPSRPISIRGSGLRRAMVISTASRADRIRKGAEHVQGHPSPDNDPNDLMLCPKCGKEYPQTSVYCTSDASKLVRRSELAKAFASAEAPSQPKEAAVQNDGAGVLTGAAPADTIADLHPPSMRDTYQQGMSAPMLHQPPPVQAVPQSFVQAPPHVDSPPNAAKAFGQTIVAGSSASAEFTPATVTTGNVSPGAASQPPLHEAPRPEPPLHATPRPADPRVSKSSPPSVNKGKICPICASRYSADVVFCGKDGTVLVRMN